MKIRVEREDPSIVALLGERHESRVCQIYGPVGVPIHQLCGAIERGLRTVGDDEAAGPYELPECALAANPAGSGKQTHRFSEPPTPAERVVRPVRAAAARR